MRLDVVEWWMRWAGAVAAFACLMIALAGIARGLRRPRGRTTGLARKVLQLPAYLLIGVVFFGPCFLLWRPLPLTLVAYLLKKLGEDKSSAGRVGA